MESIQNQSDKIGPEIFKRLKLIGKGDVGKVFLVEHTGSGKLYAMKVLDKKEMIKRNKVKRVLTEREILATADHPFIVTLYWSFQTNEKVFFIMDYCGGGEFFRTLQAQPHKCLPEDHARFYAAEVLLSLEYLHLMGFIYRDLKPENILLHETGHIMLTDFDLSKQAATSFTPQVISKMFSRNKKEIYTKPELETTSFVGTEEYISPEIIQGYGQTSSVDWWTFGILLYEMVFGTTPFRGKSQDDTFKRILAGEVHFPDHHAYPVTSSCKSLIKSLLCVEAKKRLGSKLGATEIRKHKWFDGKLNFALIRNSIPPIKPNIAFPTDTSNFRTFKEDNEEEGNAEQEPEVTTAFRDFKPVFRPEKPDSTELIRKQSRSWTVV